MSATDKPEIADETRPTPAPKPPVASPTPEELIQRCMERATKITYRKRQGKKGTSITISFERSR